MRIAIIGNGPVESRYTVQLKQYDYIIAADGGNRHCQNFDLAPDIIVGDGDSTAITFLTDPDQTTSDLQKAIAQALIVAPLGEIDLYGVVSEGRMDHTLTAIMLLANNSNIKHIYTTHWDIQYLTALHTTTITGPVGTTISIIPHSTTAQLTLSGLQWSGQITLTTHNSGISNLVISSPANVAVERGSIILMQLWN